MRLRKRKLGRREGTAITKWHRAHLTHGHDYFGGGYGKKKDWDLWLMARDWQTVGDEITDAYVSEFPGRRPFGFWEFDFPHQKQCTQCRDEITDDGCECGECQPETDYQFLLRRGLLTDDEAAQIDASIFLQHQLKIVTDEEFRAFVTKHPGDVEAGDGDEIEADPT